ncbi:hypothetical protein RJ639_026225 [Escallonia herrerae]|uniref:Aluminum-activated malate transporter n=1 Tax=Escallonia herrerae TaxID=1293975 RepID=A0AA88S6N2_9ASTE|nr:hypothetical protein RJ639_026225 [Escallonia herrerae]
MSSTIIAIPNQGEVALNQKKKKLQFPLVSNVFSTLEKACGKDPDTRKFIHCVKVGIALVLVSLLYLLDPLFKKIGGNAMWAIMTVVVAFEFFAGATLSKGINRGVGTILGGGLGCLVAILAEEIGGIGNAVAVATSVFIFGKSKFSDELHSTTAFKFEKLARSVEGCLEEYFALVSEKEIQPSANIVSICSSMLHSKSNEESQANFARWEPWHGKFGLSYPWEKYLQIGEVTRELASTILSLKGCLQSSRQPSPMLRRSIKEPCEIAGLFLAWILRELGQSIEEMKKCRAKVLIVPLLHTMKAELSGVTSRSLLEGSENGVGLAMAGFLFLLTETVEKVEVLAKEVEELGEIAGFQTK